MNRRDLFKKLAFGAVAAAPSAVASITLEQFNGLEKKVSTLGTKLEARISDLHAGLKGAEQRLDGLEKKQKIFATLVCAALLIG